jgi:hypothetical protein
MSRRFPVFWFLCAWCWLVYAHMTGDFWSLPQVKAVVWLVGSVLALLTAFQTIEWASDKYHLHGPRVWTSCKRFRGRYPVISTLVVAAVAGLAWWFLVPVMTTQEAASANTAGGASKDDAIKPDAQQSPAEQLSAQVEATLIKKYPMGFVAFDFVSGVPREQSVRPIASRRILDRYDIDFSVVEVRQPKPGRIELRLPDLSLKGGPKLLTDALTGGAWRVGELGGFWFLDEPSGLMVWVWGEVLAIRPEGISFAVGFQGNAAPADILASARAAKSGTITQSTRSTSSELSSALQVGSALGSIENDEYRAVVAEVINAFEPKAFITVGGQVIGPDGGRRVDVQVFREKSDAPTLVDVVYRQDNAPVGVEMVDAAESKGKDLRARTMLLCSNSGFDQNAIRKAKRVGVGLISVLKEGSNRATAYVEEEIYLRTIVVKSVRSLYTHPSPKKSTTAFNDITYKGVPVDDWLNTRAFMGIMGISTSGPVRFFYRLKTPTDFNSPGRKIRGVTEIAMELELEIQWAAQTVQINAKEAIYDYVRGSLRLRPGENNVTIKNLNFDTAVHLPEPPPENRLGVGASRQGEADFVFARIRGLARPPQSPSKIIDDLIDPEDLKSDPLPLSMRKKP